MRTLRQDQLSGAWPWLRQPGLTAVAIIALSLGAGANTVEWPRSNVIRRLNRRYATKNRRR
jgi:hypothetical protein